MLNDTLCNCSSSDETCLWKGQHAQTKGPIGDVDTSDTDWEKVEANGREEDGSTATEESTDGTVEELNGPLSEDAGLQIFEWCKAVKGRTDHSSTAYSSPTPLHREITHSDPHLNIGGVAQDFSSVPLASMMQIQMQ